MRRIQLDRPRLETLLAGAPAADSTAAPVLLDVVGPAGAVHSLFVRESPVLSRDLQARMPRVRTYAVTGAGEPSLTGRLDLTPAGFHAVIMSLEGGFLIEPDVAQSPGFSWIFLWRDVSIDACGPPTCG